MCHRSDCTRRAESSRNRSRLRHCSNSATIPRNHGGHVRPPDDTERCDADCLDEATLRLHATQAQPQAYDEDATLREVQELFERGGEPNLRKLEPHWRMAQTAGRI